MTAIVRHQPEPTERALRLLELEARTIADSGLVPEHLRGQEHRADLMLVGMTARAVGVTTLSMATKHVHVIEGTVALSAELQIGVAEADGCLWQVVESSSERAVVRGRRLDWPKDWPDTVITWTIDDAKRAGLLDVEWRKTKWNPEKRKVEVVARWKEGDDPKPDWVKPGDRDVKRSRRDPWHQYPDSMLLARAKSRLAQALAARALTGIGDRVDLSTPLEEHVGDEPAVANVRGRPTPEADPYAADDEITDAELVDDEGQDRVDPPAGTGDAGAPAPPAAAASTPRPAVVPPAQHGPKPRAKPAREPFPTDDELVDEKWVTEFAARCAAQDLTDDDRHALLTFACGRRIDSGKQVYVRERNACERAFGQLVRGELEAGTDVFGNWAFKQKAAS